MSKKNILFLNLPNDCPQRQFFSLPLGLAYLAADLEDNSYNLKGLDLAATQERGKSCYLQAPAKYLQGIIDFKPDYVLISCLVHNRFNVFYWAELIKKYSKNVKIILGNQFASSKPREILANIPWIDCIVLGEAIGEMKGILKAIENNNLAGVANIAYRQGGEIIVRTGNGQFNINKLPLPKIDIFCADEYVFNLGNLKFTQVIPISSSRGCPMLCTFCSCRVFEGNKYLFRSVEDLINEITCWQEKYGYDKFMFIDDTFTINQKHILEFCQQIIERNIRIKWICWSCLNINPEILLAMKRAGCVYISFGLESADWQILKKIRKNIDLKLAERVIRKCHDLEIDFRLTLLLNSGYETLESLQQTIDFLRQMKIRKSMIDSSDGIWIFPDTDLEKEFFSGARKKFDWFHQGNYDYEVECDSHGNQLVPVFSSLPSQQIEMAIKQLDN
jgi:radical SAM superfamily enzyme YgiQ (UPF0313 family)